MTGALFQVSDKVMLKPDWQGMVPVVPKLLLGRAYYIEHAYMKKGNQYVRLVGVRRDRRCLPDADGTEANIFALAFVHAGSTDAKSKGGK